MRFRLCTAILTGSVVALAGCANSNSETPAGESATSQSTASQRLKVVADVYPAGYVASQVGGDAVEVTILTPPGVEPHDLELSASQVKQIAAADIIFFVPGMVPTLATAIEQQAADRAVDITSEVDRSGLTADEAADPHVWLDPANMNSLGQVAANVLQDVSPGATPGAASFTSAMGKLTQDYSAGLANCEIEPLVVAHEAFGWLARAYGFEQHGISGLSPEAEPSPARMREIAELVKNRGVTTIYFETLVSDKAAKAIAAETGVATALLDPIEGATGGATYPEIMNANLATLREGQACS